MSNRREFLVSTAAFAAVATMGLPLRAAGSFEITRTPEEWQARLSPARYAILRLEATEKPYANSYKGETSPLLKEARNGTYHCAGCDLDVYPSATKYDSKTGWPSFWNPIAGNVRYKGDKKLAVARTEVHCRRCGGHLGHVFNDGPQPTGKRHCLNGLSLHFKAA